MTESEQHAQTIQDKKDLQQELRERDEAQGITRITAPHGQGVATQEDLDEEARQRGDENAPPRPEQSSGVTAEEKQDEEA